jgi:hypothetical protein
MVRQAKEVTEDSQLQRGRKTEKEKERTKEKERVKVLDGHIEGVGEHFI